MTPRDRDTAAGSTAAGAGVSRRALFQGVLGLVGADAVRAVAEPARADRVDPPPAERSTGALSRPAPLTPDEIDDLVAFGEILVEGAPLGAGDRRHLVEHIEYRLTRHPEFPSLYRDTLRELERLGGARFSTLTLPRGLDLVARLAAASAEPPRAGRGPRPADPARLGRTRVMRDLIEGYYASPAGWAAVEQTAFPGRCGELTRYTRPDA